MKRTIVLLLLVTVFCRYLHAYSVTVGTNTVNLASPMIVTNNPSTENLWYTKSNSIKINTTVTITADTSPNPPGSYTFQWNANIGSITGTGNVVTYTAPASKGIAAINVTIKSGSNTVYTSTSSLLVYKSIFIIKNDDYQYRSYYPSSNYVDPDWKTYTDYMESTRCKTNVGMITQSVGSANTAWKNYVNQMKNTGYVSFYFHGYAHEDFATFSSTGQLALFQASDDLVYNHLGWHYDGFGAPYNHNNSSTTWCMNQMPHMKFWFFYDMVNSPPAFNGVNFSHAGTRIDCETGGFQINFSTGFLPQYSTKGNRDLNVMQIHPLYWYNDYSNPAGGHRNDLVEWDKVIGHLRAQGDTVISAMDYYNMAATVGFVPYEQANPDTSPPSDIAAVYDGTTAGSDINTTNSSTQLSANWTASSDAQSGITGYKYAIGTAAGATDAAGWTTIGSVTSVTRTGLSLTNGTMYYFSVKAINGDGLESAGATNSNGQTVSISGTDTTPPSAPAAVRDGTGSDIDSTPLTTRLSANWDISADAESGIAKYWYAIGTAAGGTDIAAWTDNGTALSVTKTGLNLASGVKYYFSVKAENGAGSLSNAQASDGATAGAAADVTGAKPYPNPYRFSSGQQLRFNLDGNAGASIKIYTLSGSLVREILAPPGSNTTQWDVKNKEGKPIAIGIYLYRISMNNGGTLSGKLAVLK